MTRSTNDGSSFYYTHPGALAHTALGIFLHTRSRMRKPLHVIFNYIYLRVGVRPFLVRDLSTHVLNKMPSRGARGRENTKDKNRISKVQRDYLYCYLFISQSQCQ